MLPKDNYILFSLLNTKLRDRYQTLEELCKVECVDITEITNRMSEIGYSYDKNTNSFTR